MCYYNLGQDRLLGALQDRKKGKGVNPLYRPYSLGSHSQSVLDNPWLRKSHEGIEITSPVTRSSGLVNKIYLFFSFLSLYFPSVDNSEYFRKRYIYFLTRLQS